MASRDGWVRQNYSGYSQSQNFYRDTGNFANKRFDQRNFSRGQQPIQRGNDYRNIRGGPPISNKRPRSPPHQSRPQEKKPISFGRYDVYIPSHNLTMAELNVFEIKKIFPKLHIPSDFFHCDLAWQQNFTFLEPYKIGSAECDFHIFNKEVDRPVEENYDLLSELEPKDVDHSFSAKVMLLSSSTLEDIYNHTIRLASESQGSDKLSWMKQIQFLVGSRGKNELMPIGGPWSLSLDGPNPAEDENVLINTAIRTCKAQTGIDLSCCKNWYKFLELHYYRPAERQQQAATKSDECDDASSNQDANSNDSARVETVVIYLPDVYECMPNSKEWSLKCIKYKKLYDQKISPPEEKVVEILSDKDKSMDDGTIGETSESQPMDKDDTGHVSDQNDDNLDVEVIRPTHYSKLDVASLKVAELRAELDSRGFDSKGLKSQLVAKLEALLKEEEKKELKAKDDLAALAKQEGVKEKNEPPIELSDRDKRRLERYYRLDEDKIAIIVHPNTTYKDGRFECEKLSLSTLLDYRIENQKSYSFEISLFAEQFRDMILRDSAFTIYKALSVFDLQSATTMLSNGVDNAHDSDEPLIKRRKEDGTIIQKNKCTIDKNLLFSFSIFDNGHSDSLKEIDLEMILSSIGLNLSRSQIRKLIHRASNRKDILYYRKLTDKELVDGTPKDALTNNSSLDDPDYLKELSSGNGVFLDEMHGQGPNLIINGSNDDEIRIKINRLCQEEANINVQFLTISQEMKATWLTLNDAKDEEESSRSEIKRIRHELQNDREKLKDSKINQRTYIRLLRMSADHLSRISKEINTQFEKESEALKKAENPVSQSTENIPNENVEVVDTA